MYLNQENEDSPCSIMPPTLSLDYKIIRICGSGNQESHLLAAGSTGGVPRSPKAPEVGALPAE